MEEKFKNIKFYLENSFVDNLVSGGSDKELSEQVKKLHLENVENMLSLAILFDAKKLPSTKMTVEARKLLEGVLVDFKDLFPKEDFGY